MGASTLIAPIHNEVLVVHICIMYKHTTLAQIRCHHLHNLHFWQIQQCCSKQSKKALFRLNFLWEALTMIHFNNFSHNFDQKMRHLNVYSFILIWLEFLQILDHPLFVLLICRHKLWITLDFQHWYIIYEFLKRRPWTNNFFRKGIGKHP